MTPCVASESIAASCLAAHFVDRPANLRRGHAFVPQVGGEAGAFGDLTREQARLPGGRAFGAVLVERQADDDADDLMRGHELEQGRHGKALAGAAREGGQRLRQGLRFIGQREAGAARAPVETEEPTRGRTVHPCAIVAKNSTLVLVRFIRSSRNSIASTGGMSARKLRSR